MERTQRAFTFYSLLIALAVTAIVVGLAAPNFQRFARQWELARSAQALVTALHLSRTHAAQRGVPIVLCQTNGPSSCGSLLPVGGGSGGGSSGAVAAGWQVFVENTVSSPPRFDPGDELLATQSLPPTIWLRATRNAVTYWPSPRAGSTSTYLFCDTAQLAAARTVIVSQIGRPRLSDRMADGSLPNCTGS
jgi:type IV fimbrial biogenesis protein FimT